MSKIEMTKNVCKVLCNKLFRFLWIFLRVPFFVCPFTIFLLFTSFDLGVVPQKAKPPHFLNIWLRLDNGALCLHWESSLCSHCLILQLMYWARFALGKVSVVCYEWHAFEWWFCNTCMRVTVWVCTRFRTCLSGFELWVAQINCCEVLPSGKSSDPRLSEVFSC